MSSGEMPDYAHPSRFGMAVTDVPTAFDARMEPHIQAGERIIALRGAGSVNGIDPEAAGMVLEQVLFPLIEAEPTIVIFDGDPDNPDKPDIGYIAARVQEQYGNVFAAQTADWFYPPELGSNLTTANGVPIPTFVIPRGVYAGDHNRLTQSPRLTNYDGYGQVYVGPSGVIANTQMEAYCRAVPPGGSVNVTVIRATNNGLLDEEIGRKLATAVTDADREKFEQQMSQRRRPFGVHWRNDGSFDAQVAERLARERQDEGYELAVLWNVDSQLASVEILNCKRINLLSDEFDQAFAQADYYVKTRPIMARQIPVGMSERIDVKSAATGDTAYAGDWVCRKQRPDGTFGEEYVVHQDRFDGLYDPMEGSESIFVPKWDPRKLIQVDTNVIFDAPWGEPMAVRRGGYVMEAVLEDGSVERYGISQSDAEDDFVPVASLQ